MAEAASRPTRHYTAAGGVVVYENQVLVLQRPSRAELRLPKGHIDPGEDPVTAACREVTEESGYASLAVLADLGTQQVSFDLEGVHIVRLEHYFLMTLTAAPAAGARGEQQFIPAWLAWKEALAQLTFAAERTWVRRARRAWRRRAV